MPGGRSLGAEKYQECLKTKPVIPLYGDLVISAKLWADMRSEGGLVKRIRSPKVLCKTENYEADQVLGNMYPLASVSVMIYVSHIPAACKKGTKAKAHFFKPAGSQVLYSSLVSVR